MLSKLSLYNITVAICLLMIVILHGTSFIKKSHTTISVTMVQPMILPTNTTVVSMKPRRLAIFSSSIHSKLRSYVFYTPIAAAAWQRLGFDVIVVFVGDWLNLKTSHSSIIAQMNLTERILRQLNVHIIHFQCTKTYSMKMSQLVRIFSGYLDEKLVRDDDYIITSDSDIIPIRQEDYQIKENSIGFIYNAFCCGSFQRRNQTYQMYPLSHICLKKQIWRDLFLQSIQRQELLQLNHLKQSEQILLTANASFSFELISLYTRHEFPSLYDSDMIKGDSAWYMDQVYISMLINDYLKKDKNIQLDKHHKRSLRLDPGLPVYAWERQRLKDYGDAHIMHDEIFDSYRWATFKKLIDFLFKPELSNDFDFYYKQFTLTLHEKPDENESN